MLKLRKESGQALVEFALVLPIFITLLCGIIDCAWIGYQYISFDYSYREASWELSITDGDISKPFDLSGSQVSEPIMKSMEDTALGINKANISVGDDASIHLWSIIKTSQYPGATSGSYETKKNYWRYMQIKAKLIYKVQPLTPVGQALFGSMITYTKNLDKIRLTTQSNA